MLFSTLDLSRLRRRVPEHIWLFEELKLGTNREISRYTPLKFNIAIEQLASQKGK